MKNHQSKIIHPIVVTPVKQEKKELNEERGNSSSNGKGDAAFQLYCQQNLSPINSFGIGKSSFLLSPNPQTSKNFAKSKSMFSPAAGPTNFSKFNPNSHQISIQNVIQPTGGASSGDYQINNKDEFEIEFPHHRSMKESATPLYFNKFTTTPVSNKPFNQQHPDESIKNSNLPHNAEQPSRYYVYTSPIFKISFRCKEHLDKFVQSNMQDRNQIQQITLETCSEKAILPKILENDFENLQNSYKRVIQFNDEEEQEIEIEEQQVEKDAKEEQREQQSEKNKSHQHKIHGVISRHQTRGEEKRNLFEEVSNQLTTYDSQATFHPYANYNQNSTTKKTLEIKSQQSQDSQKTAQKCNESHKRKIFDSPKQECERDLHTPSTKKKKTKSSALQNKNASSSSTRVASHTKKSEEKNRNKKVSEIPISQENEDEEPLENHKTLIPFNLSTNIPCIEDKKVCCNCKKTKCLKLYCECFAASKVCEGCTCQGCFNKTEFESMRQEARKAILDRYGGAFDPKIEQSIKQFVNDEGQQIDPELKSHSKGCNCKKSNCLKKYCECFQLGVKCSKLCKCDHCKNFSGPQPPNEEGDSIMNSSVIKGGSSRKMKISSQVGGDYSQYNQYNYYQSDQGFTYYYPQYYGAYPYYGDYCMVQKQEEEGAELKKQEQIQYSPEIVLNKINKRSKNASQLAKIKNGDTKLIQEEEINAVFPAPSINKKKKSSEEKKANPKVEEKKAKEKENEKSEQNQEKIIEENPQEEAQGEELQKAKEIEQSEKQNNNTPINNEFDENKENIKCISKEVQSHSKEEGATIEPKIEDNNNEQKEKQQESNKKSKSKKSTVQMEQLTPLKTRKQINELSQSSNSEAKDSRLNNSLSGSKTSTRNHSAQKQQLQQQEEKEKVQVQPSKSRRSKN